LSTNTYLDNFLLHENVELRIRYKQYSDPNSFPAKSMVYPTTRIRWKTSTRLTPNAY